MVRMLERQKEYPVINHVHPREKKRFLQELPCQKNIP